MKNPMYKFVFILMLSLAFIGCSESAITNTATDATPLAIVVNWKKDVTAADIAGLKWLEGTWRGAGEGQEPFYERYRLDDKSLTVESFADGTLETVTDTTRYVLINGEFRYTDSKARRVAASEITADYIQFIPVIGGGNSFRFERQPGGKWRAVLKWPTTDEQPAKQKIYNMEPYKK